MKWFPKTRKSPKNVAISLPGKVEEQIKNQDFEAVYTWVNSILQTSPNSQEFKAFLEKAENSQWPRVYIDKFQLAQYFYAGEYENIIRAINKYIEQDALDSYFLEGLANAYYQLGNFEKAHDLIIKNHANLELKSKASYVENAASICLSANDFNGLKHYADLALKLGPDDPGLLKKLSLMYFELGDLETFRYIRRMLNNNPNVSANTGFEFSYTAFAENKYTEAFRLFEYRYSPNDVVHYINPQIIQHPKWNGEDLSGKTLLIATEQAIGDMVQMSRFLKYLPDIGVNDVVLEARPAIASLLQFNFPNISVISCPIDKKPDIYFDYWIGIFSLPCLLNCTEHNIPEKVGYLKPPPDNQSYWQQRVAELSSGNTPRIGLAWSGNSLHKGDRRRSVPFAMLKEYIDKFDVDFFSLQTDLPTDKPENLLDVSEELITFADTCALINEMDMVISIDSSPVHIAGALGKETWLLLPYRYEWRWSLEGESNNWYDSVKVLRQKRHGDWQEVLDDVFHRRLPSRLNQN